MSWLTIIATSRLCKYFEIFVTEIYLSREGKHVYFGNYDVSDILNVTTLDNVSLVLCYKVQSKLNYDPTICSLKIEQKYEEKPEITDEGSVNLMYADSHIVFRKSTYFHHVKT